MQLFDLILCLFNRKICKYGARVSDKAAKQPVAKYLKAMPHTIDYFTFANEV
jgi:hypothetical protein